MKKYYYIKLKIFIKSNTIWTFIYPEKTKKYKKNIILLIMPKYSYTFSTFKTSLLSRAGWCNRPVQL